MESKTKQHNQSRCHIKEYENTKLKREYCNQYLNYVSFLQSFNREKVQGKFPCLRSITQEFLSEYSKFYKFLREKKKGDKMRGKSFVGTL